MFVCFWLFAVIASSPSVLRSRSRSQSRSPSSTRSPSDDDDVAHSRRRPSGTSLPSLPPATSTPIPPPMMPSSSLGQLKVNNSNGGVPTTPTASNTNPVGAAAANPPPPSTPTPTFTLTAAQLNDLAVSTVDCCVLQHE